MSCHAMHTREATSTRPAPQTETNEGVEPTREQREEWERGPPPTDISFCIGSTTAPRQTTHEGVWVREERHKHTMVWHEGEERAHTRRHKCKDRYVIRSNAATNLVPTMHDEGPHTPTIPFVSQSATREKAGGEKDRDTHQGRGRRKVHAREKGEQR